MFYDPRPILRSFIESKNQSQTDTVENYSTGGGIIVVLIYILFFLIYLTPIILVIMRRKRVPTSVIVMTILGCFFFFGFNPIISIILILAFSDTCMTTTK